MIAVRAVALCPVDQMKERAGDITGGKPSGTERCAVGIFDMKERRALALADNARIVKLMAAKALPGAAERAARGQGRVAVAEMELARGEAGFERQQSRHYMGDPVGI